MIETKIARRNVLPGIVQRSIFMKCVRFLNVPKAVNPYREITAKEAVIFDGEQVVFDGEDVVA